MRYLIFFLSAVPYCSFGQYQSFIQYNYAVPVEVPAALASDYHASFTTIFNTQQAGSSVLLSAGYIAAKMPLLRNPHQRATIGLNYGANHSNTLALKQQLINTTLAYSFNINKTNAIAFGLNVGYAFMDMDLTGVIYPDGPEDMPDYFSNSLEIGGSFYWNSTDAYGDNLAYFGASAFGLNHYFNSDSTNQGHIKLLGGFRMITKGKLALSPKMRVMIIEAGKTSTRVGIDFNYSLSTFSFGTSRSNNSLNFEVNAVVNSGIQMAMQVNQPAYSVGFGYAMDFARSSESPFSANAFEVLFVWRKDMGPKQPKAKKWNNEHAEKVASYKSPIVQKVARPEIPKADEVEDEIVYNEQELSPEVDLMMNGEVVPVISLGEVNGIGFEFNSTQITDESKSEIQSLAMLLDADDSYQIVLIGHTDNVGTHKVNQRISLQRAQALAEELERKGISRDRIIVEGRGEDEPKVSNNSEEGRTLNRRVEFFVIRR